MPAHFSGNLRNAVELSALGARLSRYILSFASILDPNITPKTSPRPPNTSLEATQEPLKSSARLSQSHAKRPHTLAQSVQDRQELQKPLK